MAEFVFDSSGVQPNDFFEPLPPNWYDAKLIESERKPTKDGKGEYLNLTFQILTPEFANRKVWDRINIKNDNESAQRIAHGQLASFVRACGLTSITDTQQLHGITVLIRLGVRPADQVYDASNVVKGYKATVSQVVQEKPWGPPVTQASGAASVPPATLTVTPSDKPPWIK
jgi:hypothetical protein